jgi:hypothetical protein
VDYLTTNSTSRYGFGLSFKRFTEEVEDSALARELLSSIMKPKEGEHIEMIAKQSWVQQLLNITKT